MDRRPDARIPKNANGAPNLSAPAPKAADGKPDLSRVWRPEHNQKCPPDGCPDNQMSEQFLDFGYGLKDGLPYQPWAAQHVKQRSEQVGQDDPTSHCFPGGIVRFTPIPPLTRSSRRQRLIVILSEREVTYRQIFMDGRPLPTIRSDLEGLLGRPLAGDTLVVQSNGFRGEDLWLDRKGSPLTDAATITERIRRVNYGRIEIQSPSTIPKRIHALHRDAERISRPGAELMDFVCLENNTDPSGPSREMNKIPSPNSKSQGNNASSPNLQLPTHKESTAKPLRTGPRLLDLILRRAHSGIEARRVS